MCVPSRQCEGMRRHAKATTYVERSVSSSRLVKVTAALVEVGSVVGVAAAGCRLQVRGVGAGWLSIA